MGTELSGGRRPPPRDPRRLPRGWPVRSLHRRRRNIGATLVVTPERHLPGRDPGPRRGPTSAVPVALSPHSSEPRWRLRPSHRLAYVVSHPRRTRHRHRRAMGHRSPTGRPGGLLAVLRRSAVRPRLVHQAEAIPTRPTRRQAVCACVRDETTTHRIRCCMGHLLRAPASSPSPPRPDRLRRGYHTGRPQNEPASSSTFPPAARPSPAGEPSAPSLRNPTLDSRATEATSNRGVSHDVETD